jgi:hypothetical protein
MSLKPHMEQDKETKLAYEIATALNDLDSIDWHISNAKKYPESFLREKLADVLSRKDIYNPAKYFNWSIKHGKRTRN